MSKWPRHGTDVDPIAVERLISGDPPAITTTAERTSAVREMAILGLSAELSAQRMRCSPRTVIRYRGRGSVRLHRELTRAWRIAQKCSRRVPVKPTAGEIEEWAATARWLAGLARREDAA